MEIIPLLKQAKNISNEIKRISLRRKELMIQKSEVEEQICEYLKEKNQIGIKHENCTFMLKEVKKTKLKPNNEREKEALTFLNSKISGDTSSTETLEKINEIMKQKNVSYETVLKMNEKK